jgi:hypothetical protein
MIIRRKIKARAKMLSILSIQKFWGNIDWSVTEAGVKLSYDF